MKAIASIFFKHKQGGHNKRLYELYLGLANRGVRVHYIASEKFPIDHPNIFAHIIKVPFSNRENYIFWAFFIIMAQVVMLIITQKNKVDRFVVFEPFYACLCLFAKYWYEKPLITFIRSDVTREYQILKKPILQRIIYKYIELIGLRISDKIISNNNSLVMNLIERNKINANIFYVIPNNIRNLALLNTVEKQVLRHQYDLSEEDFVVSTAAVFNDTKNISYLLKSFSMVKITNAHLLLIGDAVGKEKDGRRLLEEQVRILGIQKKTTFTGWLNDPSKLVEISDLFVLPSREEGSPNALLEALGCGIPCLGSRITEIREVLEYEELMFSLSSEGELTEKIERAATDSEYYTLICELSGHRRKKFTFEWEDEVIKQIINVNGYTKKDDIYFR